MLKVIILYIISFIYYLLGKEVTLNDNPGYMYFVNDGVYGSFNCLMYDHAEVKATLAKVKQVERTLQSICSCFSH